MHCSCERAKKKNNMDDADLFYHAALQPHSKIVHITGGGAYKFASMLKQRLGITVKKVDEMESLISGLNFLLKNIEDEAFTYENHVKIPKSFKVSF